MGQVKIVALMVVLLCGLALVGTSSAMSSPQYTVDWIAMGAGGAPMQPTTYALGSTTGQPAVGRAHSDSYLLCAGYWCGVGEEYRIYLPLVSRGV